MQTQAEIRQAAAARHAAARAHVTESVDLATQARHKPAPQATPPAVAQRPRWLKTIEPNARDLSAALEEMPFISELKRWKTHTKTTRFNQALDLDPNWQQERMYWNIETKRAKHADTWEQANPNNWKHRRELYKRTFLNSADPAFLTIDEGIRRSEDLDKLQAADCFLTGDDRKYHFNTWTEYRIDFSLYNESNDKELATPDAFVSAGTHQEKPHFTDMDRAHLAENPFNGRNFLVPHMNGKRDKAPRKYTAPRFLEILFGCTPAEAKALSEQLIPLELRARDLFQLLKGATKKKTTAAALTAYLANINNELATVNDYTQQDHIDWWADVYNRANHGSRPHVMAEINPLTLTDKAVEFYAWMNGKRDHKTYCAIRADHQVERENAKHERLAEEYNKAVEYSDGSFDLDFFDFEDLLNSTPATGDPVIGYHPIGNGTEGMPYEIAAYIADCIRWEPHPTEPRLHRVYDTERLDELVKAAPATWWSYEQTTYFWTRYADLLRTFGRQAIKENGAQYRQILSRLANTKSAAKLPTVRAFLACYTNGKPFDIHGESHTYKKPTDLGGWFAWKIYKRRERKIKAKAEKSKLKAKFAAAA